MIRFLIANTQRQLDSQPEPCPPCPTCGTGPTRVTIVSNAGRYCLCDACGHAWHEDYDTPRQPSR